MAFNFNLFPKVGLHQGLRPRKLGKQATQLIECKSLDPKEFTLKTFEPEVVHK